MTNDEPARLIIQNTCIVCKRIQHFETPEDVTGYPVDDAWVCSRECLEQHEASSREDKRKTLEKEVKAIRAADKAATKEYERFMAANPSGRPTDNEAWLALTDEVRDRTKALFTSLTNSEERVISGYVPHRVVGNYVVFVDTAGGGATGMGIQAGHRNFLAVHINTGVIRKEGFDRHRDPFKWWMNLVKVDDGTASEDEWKDIMKKDSLHRLFERLGIEPEEEAK